MSIKALTFGFMYLMSRAGGVAIPLFLNTVYYPVLLGVLSVSSGYFMGKLPETLGKKLLDDVPETIRSYSVFSIAEINPQDITFIRDSIGKNSMLVKDKMRMTIRESNNSVYFNSNKF